MATFRQVHTSFWQDSFVLELTPEEKYFYLYLLTNSKTTQCGIYELPKKVIELETGYNSETVEKLLKRFIDYGKIKYNEENGEIMIVNWIKYNRINSSKVRACITKELQQVKTKEFVDTFLTLCKQYGYPIDTVSIGYGYGIDTVSKDQRNGIDTVCIDYGEEKEKEKEKENNTTIIRGNLLTKVDELVDIFKNIKGVNYDYISDPIFFEGLLTKHSYEDILHALDTLKRKAEVEKIKDPRRYIETTLERMREEKQKPPATSPANLPNIDDETFDRILAEVSGLSLEEVRRL